MTRYLFLFFTALMLGCSSTPKTQQMAINDSNQVEYVSFLTPGSKRTVIIIPPTGGVNYLDKSYAEEIQQRGQSAIIAVDWTGSDEESTDLSLHQRLHERAVRALNKLVDSIPEDQTVSVLGTSVGGIFASILASENERVDRVFVIGTGVTIPEIIVRSQNEILRGLKSKRMKKYQFKSEAEYLSRLSEKFRLDPTLLSKGFQSKKLGMSVLTEDDIVPANNQLALRELWKPEKVIERENGHFYGIVFTWLYHEQEIVDFLVM